MNNHSSFIRFMSKLIPSVLVVSLLFTQNAVVFAKEDNA